MKELKIGGQELKALGARPGPDFGKLSGSSWRKRRQATLKIAGSH